MKRRLLIGVLLGSTVVASSAFGQMPNEELVCRANEARMDKYGYLRSLSLDLLGRPPTVEEYAALDSAEDVPDTVIDQMMDTEDFVQRVVRWHKALLWNNVNRVRILNYQTSFTRSGSGSARRYWRGRTSDFYRGDRVPCDNTPATFDAQGNVQYRIDADGLRREGYVLVNPYWDPTSTIKVCAFDAQDRAVSSSGTDCTSSAGLRDPECGCGANLNLCRYGYSTAINEALNEDVNLRVAAVIRNKEPYTELFNGRRAFVNGPLVHYLNYQKGVSDVSVRPSPFDESRLPDIPFTDYYYHEVELPAEHAGLLTSPAFLLRFQTNRARANRFYEAFLCQPFSPPPGGLPNVDPNKTPDPDLQQRDGCKYCHALLEPAAAHWGRWTEQGMAYLDPVGFPSTRNDCQICGTTGQLCSRECRFYYITRTFSAAEDQYIGQLQSFQFLRPQHQPNVDMGPKLLVSTALVDDRFPNCMAQRALEGMFGRGLTTEERAWLGELSRDFVRSNYDYRALVKSIVKSGVYRRVR